jgi:hypothetical protein
MLRTLLVTQLQLQLAPSSQRTQQRIELGLGYDYRLT